MYFVVFYNLISKDICSDCTDFCLQIFVYDCVFWKKGIKTLTKPFTFQGQTGNQLTGSSQYIVSPETDAKSDAMATHV